MTFQHRVEAIVRDFLETALVVDDAALGLVATPSARDHVKLTAEESHEPATGDRNPRVRLDLELVEPPGNGIVDETLETRVLIDSFAKDGIICAVIAPLPGDDIHESVLKAASRADLLVFDWELHRDGGATARALIKGVLEQDASAERRRLRVIAVYTSQPDLVSIMGRVAKYLGLESAEIQDNGLTLVKDGWRIVGLIKPVVENPPKALAERRVDEAALPARLAAEFARLTDGLVPSVALAALATIRNETHRILEALGPVLDVAYLGHRVASSFPKEAEGHLVSLLAAEIASILDDRDVGAFADIAAIGEWLNAARVRKDPLKSGSALKVPHIVTTSQLTRMLTEGLGLEPQMEAQAGQGLSKADLKKIRRQAAHLFTNTPEEALLAHNKFANRMAVKTIYARPRRVLQLGTIVARDTDYLLCVQPRCDSVRIAQGEIRGFPFLPLVVAVDHMDKHQFVVPDPRTSELVRLQLMAKPLDILMVRFAAGENQCVEARRRGQQWGFSNTQRRRYVWVAELKTEFAQRVAVDLGSQLARVGLTESELVRVTQ